METHCGYRLQTHKNDGRCSFINIEIMTGFSSAITVHVKTKGCCFDNVISLSGYKGPVEVNLVTIVLSGLSNFQTDARKVWVNLIIVLSNQCKH